MCVPGDVAHVKLHVLGKVTMEKVLVSWPEYGLSRAHSKLLKGSVMVLSKLKE